MRRAQEVLRWLLVAALGLVSVAANARDISIYQRTDDFKGFTTYFTEEEQPKLEGGSFISERYVYMSFKAAAPSDGVAKPYAIEITANLPDWMFINEGESLVLKVDGEVVGLTGPGSSDHQEIQTDGVTEVAYYYLSLDTLRKLANAKEIQFRVYGKRSQLTGEFTPRMLDELRLFADRVPAMIHDPAAGVPPSVAGSLPKAAFVPARAEFGADYADAWKFVQRMDAKILGIPGLNGATVSRVASGSIADKAGIKSADMIFKFNGKSFANADALRSLVGAVQPGEQIEVSVIRARAAQKPAVVELQAQF